MKLESFIRSLNANIRYEDEIGVEEIPNFMHKWIKQMKEQKSDFRKNVRKVMGSNVKRDQKRVEIDSNLNVVQIDADKDDQNRIHDDCATVYYKEGHVLQAKFIRGQIQGRTCMELPEGPIECLTGKCRDNCWNGWVEVHSVDFAFHEEHFIFGIKTGNFRRICKQGRLQIQITQSDGCIYRLEELLGNGIIITIQEHLGEICSILFF